VLRTENHRHIAASVSFQEALQAIRVASKSEAEHQLLPGRRPVRAEFFIPSQIEKTVFRQKLDRGPGCINLRSVVLEFVYRRRLDRRGWGDVDLVIGDLPLGISDWAHREALKDCVCKGESFRNAPFERHHVTKRIMRPI
jgi:hypothetical protein